MSRDITSIEIKKATWKELNQRKEPGDSFDDVIQRLLVTNRTKSNDTETERTESDDGDPYHGHANECPECGTRFDTVPELLEHMQDVSDDHFG